MAFLTEQGSALVPHEATGRLALANIDIPIDRNAIVPLAVESLRCPLADAAEPTGPPLAFVVPRLRFRALTERLLPKGESAPCR